MMRLNTEIGKELETQSEEIINMIKGKSNLKIYEEAREKLTLAISFIQQQNMFLCVRDFNTVNFYLNTKRLHKGVPRDKIENLRKEFMDFYKKNYYPL